MLSPSRPSLASGLLRLVVTATGFATLVAAALAALAAAALAMLG